MFAKKTTKKTKKFISLNIKHLVFVAYSIEFELKRSCKSLYSVFIYVFNNVPTSLELGFAQKETQFRGFFVFHMSAHSNHADIVSFK